MFLRKNNVYPCKPQFYYIKVGFKGVKIYRHVFVMFCANADCWLCSQDCAARGYRSSPLLVNIFDDETQSDQQCNLLCHGDGKTTRL